MTCVLKLRDWKPFLYDVCMLMWKFRRILHPQAALVRVSIVAAVAISIVLPGVRQKPPTVAGHFIVLLASTPYSTLNSIICGQLALNPISSMQGTFEKRGYGRNYKGPKNWVLAV